MGRVHGIGAVDPADGDDAHRRRLGSITRIWTVLVWLRSIEPPGIEVEVVQRVAGRVGRRDVEGVEVVPNVLDLRAAGHGEAEPAEEVDQLLGRLGQGVPTPQSGTMAGEGHIDPPPLLLLPLDPTASRLERGFQLSLDPVEPLAVGLPRRWLERLEPFLGGLDPAVLLAEERDPGGLGLLGRARLPERLQAVGEQGVQVGHRDGERVVAAHAVRAVWRARTSASCRSRCSRTMVTIASNASGSWIASSDRLLRSRPTRASLSPWIRRL